MIYKTSSIKARTTTTTVRALAITIPKRLPEKLSKNKTTENPSFQSKEQHQSHILDLTQHGYYLEIGIIHVLWFFTQIWNDHCPVFRPWHFLWMKLCNIAFSWPGFFFISANFKCHQRQHNSDHFFFSKQLYHLY